MLAVLRGGGLKGAATTWGRSRAVGLALGAMGALRGVSVLEVMVSGAAKRLPLPVLHVSLLEGPSFCACNSMFSASDLSG